MPGMVTPTFFLWEIIQKLFFLSLSFHILATGSQWVPGGPLGHFRAKTGFLSNFQLNSMFFSFLRFFKSSFLLKNKLEARRNTF